MGSRIPRPVTIVMDTEQQSYQEKKEVREQQKDAVRNTQKRAKRAGQVKSIIIGVIVIAAAGVGVYFLVQDSTPMGEDFSRSVTILSAGHITPGSSLPEYTSNPPTSGPHYGQTARAGFREEAIVDQNIIHNLEHGGIWISYRPSVSEEIKEGLKKFKGGKIIITSREANEFDIALAAWGRIDTFNIEDGVLPKERIEDFIKRYTDRGPERVPGAIRGI